MISSVVMPDAFLWCYYHCVLQELFTNRWGRVKLEFLKVLIRLVDKLVKQAAGVQEIRITQEQLSSIRACVKIIADDMDVNACFYKSDF